MIDNAYSIDWLSGTFKGSITDTGVRDVVSFGFPKRAWTMGTPRFGYGLMFQHPFGHSIMSNVKRPEMGVHLSFTGRALRSLSEGGITTLSMLEWMLNEGAKITRIDLAIDVYDEPIDIIALAGKARVKACPGSARKWSSIKGSEGGTTAYIGSRKSEKFMRIYDKAVESGQRDRNWTRFELEIKGDSAKTVANDLGSIPLANHAAYVKGIMRALFNPDDDFYQKLMDCEAVHIAATKDTDDTTLEWLVSSVAKTLAKTMARRSDVDVWGMFQDAVSASLKTAIDPE